jgi:hypothetical protein
MRRDEDGAYVTITQILAANRPSALSSALLYPRHTIQYRDWDHPPRASRNRDCF